jgi:hypothetical protein
MEEIRTKDVEQSRSKNIETCGEFSCIYCLHPRLGILAGIGEGQKILLRWGS